jgi:hypothetical protein
MVGCKIHVMLKYGVQRSSPDFNIITTDFKPLKRSGRKRREP